MKAISALSSGATMLTFAAMSMPPFAFIQCGGPAISRVIKTRSGMAAMIAIAAAVRRDTRSSGDGFAESSCGSRSVGTLATELTAVAATMQRGATHSCQDET